MSRKKKRTLSKLKIGVLGGAFSPVHKGHLFLAKYVKEHCGLDKVIMIPTGRHPFKEGVLKLIDSEHRINMLEIATRDEEGIEVSDIEVKSPEVSYTYVTLCKLKKIYGNDCEISFITGTDELLSLERWYAADKLLKEFSFIVGIRPQYEMDKVADRVEFLSRDFGANINIVNLPAPDVSSTEVRKIMYAGEDLKALVPGPVIEYITDNKLYIE